MGGGVLSTVWGSAMLGLLMLWQSSIVCRAIGCGPPNLASYEGHFPAIISDLRLFLPEQRKIQIEKGIIGASGYRVAGLRKFEKTKQGVKRGRSKKRSKLGIPRKTGGVSGGLKRRTANYISNDGLYGVDLLSRWDGQVEVWSTQVDEFDVVLQPGQSWTQELKQYRTTYMTLTASMKHNLSRLQIEADPFGGFTRPYKNHRLTELLKKLPCRFFRLSKWVFDIELGALAVIYVQAAPGNMNMLARFALIHKPTSLLETPSGRKLSTPNFHLWIYEKPTDSEPMAGDAINLDTIIGAMESLALHNDSIKRGMTSNNVTSYTEQLPSPVQGHPNSLPCDDGDNSYNHASNYTNDEKHEILDLNGEELDVARILASLKGVKHEEERIGEERPMKGVPFL